MRRESPVLGEEFAIYCLLISFREVVYRTVSAADDINGEVIVTD
jgi:hypothetical protein